MKLRKGSHDATGLRFGIVVAKFNRSVTNKLLSSCLEELEEQGVRADDIEVVRVPGAFEIPLVAKTMARTGRFDAVICLGAGAYSLDARLFGRREIIIPASPSNT